MLNKVILIGYVQRDPIVKRLDENMTLANLSLMTFEQATNKDGVSYRREQFHQITVWNRQANWIEQHIHKGDFIYVEGSLRYRKYADKENNIKQSTEIYADILHKMNQETPKSEPQENTPILQNIETTPLDQIQNQDILPF